MPLVPSPDHPPSATVLVVDDEPAIRETIALFLEAEGYAVRTAPDGLAALAALEQDGIDLVLSDVRMPRLDGIALTHRLHQHEPAVPVLLMSAVTPIPELPEVPSLRKPFAFERLMHMIAAVLAQAGETSAAHGRDTCPGSAAAP